MRVDRQTNRQTYHNTSDPFRKRCIDSKQILLNNKIGNYAPWAKSTFYDFPVLFVCFYIRYREALEQCACSVYTGT